jgi:hypothetical protein
MKKGIIIHSSYDRKEYFFSTDHCQGVHAKDTYPKEDFVPTSFYLPCRVAPRPEFPDGWINTLESLLKLHFSDSKEIPNPDPMYQPNSLG